MATGSFKVKNSLNVQPQAGSVVSVEGDVAYNDASKKLEIHDGSTADRVVQEVKASQGANRLKSKDLEATTTAIVDPVDTTKKILFDASGAATGKTTTLASSAATSNKTLTLPNATDTLVGLATSDVLTNKSISGSTNTLSAIPDSALNTISTAGKVSNSATTATSANTASAIVARDVSGNFTAGTISAAVSGVASGNTTITPANHSVVVSSATNALSTAAPSATSGVALVSAGASADPAFGTVVEAGGGTNQTTYAKGDMLYASATNALSKLGIGTANQVIKQVNGVPAWATAPTAGINYLNANPDAEVDVSGWTAYADAAQNIPVDATGGSPSSTWTRTTSTPLRGSASFLWTRTANNRQGEGVSYPFTIDSADQARILTISFDYKVASGTFIASDGITPPLNDGTTSQNTGMSDLEVFVYDVTNAILIPVSPQTLASVSTIDASFQGTFQTNSNSTSYRLAIHTARSTAVAFTMQFDNFYVGPQVINRGAPITDLVAYTVSTATGSGTMTNAVTVGNYRRIGDYAEITGRVTFSGAAGTWSGYFPTLPTGLVIDTTKLGSSTASETFLGDAYFLDSGIEQYAGSVIYRNSTVVNVVALDLVTFSGTAPVVSRNVTNAAPFSFGTGDVIYFKYIVPIVGWSSSVQMSSDAATGVVAFSATTATASVSGSVSDVTWTVVTQDTNSSFNGTTSYTVPVSGTYKVDCMLDFGNNTNIAGDTAFTEIYVDGAAVAINKQYYAVINQSNMFVPVFYQAPLKAGQIIKIRCLNSSNTPVLNSSIYNRVSIERISGPQQIALSDSVYAYSAAKTPTATITSSRSIVKFPSMAKDSHGAYSASTGLYTIPISGLYQISSSIETTSASNAVGDFWEFEIGANADSISIAHTATVVSSTSVLRYITQGSGIIRLNAGDTVGVYIGATTTTPVIGSFFAQSFFNIVKVG